MFLDGNTVMGKLSTTPVPTRGTPLPRPETENERKKREDVVSTTVAPSVETTTAVHATTTAAAKPEDGVKTTEKPLTGKIKHLSF